MPFALLLIGALFIVIAYQGTQAQFFALLSKDFGLSGGFRQSFWAWIVSIGVIGAVGYVPKFKEISDSFLVLVLLVLFISNKGFFNQFNAAFRSGTP